MCSNWSTFLFHTSNRDMERRSDGSRKSRSGGGIGRGHPPYDSRGSPQSSRRSSTVTDHRSLVEGSSSSATTKSTYHKHRKIIEHNRGGSSGPQHHRHRRDRSRSRSPDDTNERYDEHVPQYGDDDDYDNNNDDVGATTNRSRRPVGQQQQQQQQQHSRQQLPTAASAVSRASPASSTAASAAVTSSVKFDPLEQERRARMARLRAENEEEERQMARLDPNNPAQHQQQHNSDDPTKSGIVQVDASELEGMTEEEQMQRLLGFGDFASTKGQAVADNQTTAARGAATKHKARKYRQYMNRKGGFNRPLDKMD